jgi:4-hydroxybenzoate polyprenyltransferase
MTLLRLLRVEQWLKNLFLFAGIVFGLRLHDPHSWFLSIAGFFLFSLVSSSVYIVNDIRDRAEDRLHPRKSRRPIAAGLVSIPTALLAASLCLFVGLAGAAVIDRAFLLILLIYLWLQAAYNYRYKHVAIVDVILIAIGFVLRAIAGAVLVNVAISDWLVICTFTLCLFMGFSKRRCELNAFAGENGTTADATRHRRTLADYTPDLLNHMTTVTAGIAIVSYILYATDDRTIGFFHTRYLLYTLPMVVYAIFRFAMLVEHSRVDGPTDVLLRDRPFQAAILLWIAAVLVIIYGSRLPLFLEEID